MFCLKSEVKGLEGIFIFNKKYKDEKQKSVFNKKYSNFFQGWFFETVKKIQSPWKWKRNLNQVRIWNYSNFLKNGKIRKIGLSQDQNKRISKFEDYEMWVREYFDENNRGTLNRIFSNKYEPKQKSWHQACREYLHEGY